MACSRRNPPQPDNGRADWKMRSGLEASGTAMSGGEMQHGLAICGPTAEYSVEIPSHVCASVSEEQPCHKRPPTFAAWMACSELPNSPHDSGVCMLPAMQPCRHADGP